MSWRLARALETLRSQVNAKWPKRGKGSDGTIGDEAHASRSSDHNPWVKDGAMGIVTGMDLTHDPMNGFDSYAFADMLLKNQDSRLKYVISNRRIGSGPAGPQAGVWRKYTGANAHDHHCHISVLSDKGHYDGTRDWDIAAAMPPDPEVIAVFIAPPATLRKGDKGPDVQTLQAALHLLTDGQFGPITEATVKSFQTEHKLTADGICGPQTWKAIGELK